ncbi:hypothetical protein [Sorangium sp. So ce128]|uniref:hypothetical protein n=1 Tax=Sorangium sp. So ce128 TaxID=3133281 RepID=UPI003F6370EE
MAVDYNRDAERTRARRSARLSAWRHLVHLQPEDIRAVLIEMLADLDDNMIPALTPIDALPKEPTAPAATAQQADVAPTPATAAAPTGRRHTVAKGPAPVLHDPWETHTEEPADETEGSENVGDLARGVLAAAGRAMSAPEIAEGVLRVSPKTDRRNVIQWLTREYLKEDGDLVRRGERGSFRYALKNRGTTKVTDMNVEKAPERKGAPTGDSYSEPIVAQLLKRLAAGPSGLDELATEILGSAHGEARKTVRNILYYLRDKKGLVRRREEDEKWEVITPH